MLKDLMSAENHFSALYTDFYELTMAQGYFRNGKAEKSACFDYFYRKQPFDNGYVIFAGLHDLLETLTNYSFSKEDLQYLKSLGFQQDFLDYLKTFRFRGTIYAPAEGEIIFPNEPVIRIEGTMLEGQIIETLVLNIINFQSLIATKASRMRYAAEGRLFMDFGLRRAQGLGGIMASRAAIIGGAGSTSNVYSARKYGLKPSGTMAHSWIESFDDELSAFRTFAEMYPDNSILLVDTYDTLHSGVPKAIQVAREMEQREQRLTGIRLDSGDLAYLSKKARKMLDENGLQYVKIIASNQLDEYLIKSLLSQGAPIDGFGVGTNLVVGRDDGALDGVYKLTMFDSKPRLKISDNIEKILLPGVKKVFRYFDEEGYFGGDVVLLEEENSAGTVQHPYKTAVYRFENMRHEELYSRVMQNGDILIPVPAIGEIAAYVDKRLALLRDEHKRFENPHIYTVGISTNLFSMRQRLIEHYRKTYIN